MSITSFLTHKFPFPLFIFFLISCRNDRSKDRLKAIIPICNQRLFVEKYEVWGGGAYDGDMISDYLTDSINFRLYIGTFDNAHENYTYVCKGDSVYIEKVSIEEEGIPYNTRVITKVIERKSVDLKVLQKQHKFE